MNQNMRSECLQLLYLQQNQPILRMEWLYGPTGLLLAELL